MPAAADPARREPPTPNIEEARRLFAASEESESRPDRGRQSDRLKAFLAYVEGHKDPLIPDGPEVAKRLDEASVVFYRSNQPELALRAVDVGLSFAPGSSALLHHKALVLLAQNRNVDNVVPLLDKALEANPHDKAIWATRGDALRLSDRPSEAADSYVHAQRLDATSSQYVDRALKLVPDHSEALRLKVEIARAHGGDRSAVAAIDTLLKEVPEDVGLHCTKAEILDGIGETDAALD
ncbi:MAG: hypothetical protein L3J81_06405, partial [Thermoplasmata archaeon]|nr:hypothetical protein [Thermoplasmata archaeon]